MPIVSVAHIWSIGRICSSHWLAFYCVYLPGGSFSVHLWSKNSKIIMCPYNSLVRLRKFENKFHYSINRFGWRNLVWWLRSMKKFDRTILLLLLEWTIRREKSEKPYIFFQTIFLMEICFWMKLYSLKEILFSQVNLFFKEEFSEEIYFLRESILRLEIHFSISQVEKSKIDNYLTNNWSCNFGIFRLKMDRKTKKKNMFVIARIANNDEQSKLYRFI